MDTTKLQEGYAKWVDAGKPKKAPEIKAARSSFKSKMAKLDAEWPDKIWNEIVTGNRVGPHPSSPKYKQWIADDKPPKPLSIMLPVAALALTGARPISLERGITFRLVEIEGIRHIEAAIDGAKIIKDGKGAMLRGQEGIRILWRVSSPEKIKTHRKAEMQLILNTLLELEKKTGKKQMTIAYDAEAISTSLRLLSKKLWPRRKTLVSGVCYRELFSSKAKAAGMDPEQIAAAMGHLSTRSQQKYLSKSRTKGGKEPVKGEPIFDFAIASTSVKIAPDPNIRLAEFKAEIKSQVAAKKLLDSMALIR